MDFGTFFAALFISLILGTLLLVVGAFFEPLILELWMIPVATIVMMFWVLPPMLKQNREEKEEKEKREKLKNLKLISQSLDLQEKISNLIIELSAKLPDLKKNEESFYMLIDTISKEEEKLSDLKRRHPRIQSMIKTRKEGDSKSEDINEVKNLLGKLKTKRVDLDDWNEGPKLDAQYDEE